MRLLLALLVSLIMAVPARADTPRVCVAAGDEALGHAITFETPLPGWRVYPTAPGEARLDRRSVSIDRTTPLILPDTAAGRVVFVSERTTTLMLCTPDTAPAVYVPLVRR